MKDNDEFFYILLINRKYRRENEINDFHVEKIFEIEDVNYLLEKAIQTFSLGDYFIITNDSSMLEKYILTINFDEFKMLCRKEYDKRKIRINENHFQFYNAETFEYFSKVLNNEIVSASMSWNCETIYPYDDSTIGIQNEEYEGWRENFEFEYFRTPNRYKTSTNDKPFYINDLRKANIKQLENYISVNILDIGKPNFSDLNWEWRNGTLRYYDKQKCVRFYISTELLKALSDSSNEIIEIKTKLDQNHYIEYHAIGFINQKQDNYSPEQIDSYEGENRSYKKYNGVYGLDDNTIDNAFEGDPENYWNID